MIESSSPVTHPAPVRRAWLLGLASVIALLGLAFWLRWQYATQVNLHVDEFTTLWAARQTQAHGAPFMPSGVLYTRGLLSSYLVALAQMLAGDAPLVGRTLSIGFGVAAVFTIFLAGRREWTALGAAPVRDAKAGSSGTRVPRTRSAPAPDASMPTSSFVPSSTRAITASGNSSSRTAVRQRTAKASSREVAAKSASLTWFRKR